MILCHFHQPASQITTITLASLSFLVFQVVIFRKVFTAKILIALSVTPYISISHKQIVSVVICTGLQLVNKRISVAHMLAINTVKDWVYKGVSLV